MAEPRKVIVYTGHNANEIAQAANTLAGVAPEGIYLLAYIYRGTPLLVEKNAALVVDNDKIDIYTSPSDAYEALKNTELLNDFIDQLCLPTNA